MARISRDLDKKLLIVGQTLIQEVGVSSLSMREVAKIAGVNLGMLNYYFDGKEDFVFKVLNEIYAPFIVDLQALIDQDDLNLEHFFYRLSQFSAKNKKLVVLIVKDLISNDPMVKKFVTVHFSKHVLMISKLIESKINDKNKAEYVTRLIISIIGMPNLMLGVKENIVQKELENSESEDDVIYRVKMAMEIMRKYS